MVGAPQFYGRVRSGPISTRSVSPTTASAGVLRKGKAPRPQPQYKERRKTLGHDQTRIRNMERQRLLDLFGKAAGGQQANPYSALDQFPNAAPQQMKAPRVPLQPVAGNPYAGVDKAIGRFAAASRARTAGDARAARRGMKGVHDPGAGIAGSINSELAGIAAEQAANVSSLRNQVRAKSAEAELQRRGQLAKARYDQRSQQMKLDTEAAETQQLSLGMIQQLAAEGLDPTAFMGNPLAAAVTLGRLRFARRQETGLPADAWAQAAKYGLKPPNEYGSAEEFYWQLGQARRGQNTGGDAIAFIQALQQAGLLKGLTP